MITAFGGSEGYSSLAIIAFGAFEFIVPKYYCRLGKMKKKKESGLLMVFQVGDLLALVLFERIFLVALFFSLAFKDLKGSVLAFSGFSLPSLLFWGGD